MARYFGEIGFGESVEDPPGSGIHTERVQEFPYKGDVIRASRKLEDGIGLNQDLAVQNRISIISDEYANAHFFMIRYARWEGVLWAVTTVEVQSPRLILTLGGVYHGPTV